MDTRSVAYVLAGSRMTPHSPPSVSTRTYSRP